MIHSDTRTTSRELYAEAKSWQGLLRICIIVMFTLLVASSSDAWSQSSASDSSDQSRDRIAAIIPIINYLLLEDAAEPVQEEVDPEPSLGVDDEDFPVAQIVAPKLTLSQTILTVGLDQTSNVTVSGLNDGEGTLRFSSSNPLIASVDRLTGEVRGIALGSTRIDVFRLNNDGFRDSDIESFVVNVGDPMPQPALTVAIDPLVLEIDQSLINAVSGGAGTGTFNHVSADPSIATVDAISGLVTGVSEGTTTITVSRTGDSNFLDATPISYQVVVNRIEQAPLTVAADPLILDIGQSLASGAGGGSGDGAFAFVSANPSIVSVDPLSGVVTGVAEGTTGITVNRSGNDTFFGAAPISFTVQVNRLEQAPITVAADPLILDIGQSSTSGAGGGSGDGAFAFVSANPSIASVDPLTGLVTGVAEGTTGITVNRSGNDTFFGAAPISFTVQVNRLEQAPITVAADPLILDIGQSSTSGAGGGSGDGAFAFVSADPSIASVDPLSGLVTGVAEGTTGITVNRSGNDTFFGAAPISFTVQVNRLEQAPLIVAADPLILEIDQSSTNAFTGGSGTGAFAFVSNDVSVATVNSVTGLVTGVAEGTTTITVSRAGDDTFLAAIPITYTVQVVRLAQPALSVEFDPLILEIGQSAINTLSGGAGTGVTSFSSLDTSIATVDAISGLVLGVAEGTTTIQVSRSGDGRFLDADPISYQVTVNRIPQPALTAQFDPLEIQINQSLANVITGGAGSGELNFVSTDPSIAAVVDSTSGLIMGVTAGQTVITVTRSGDADFLDAAPLTFLVNVSRLDQLPLTVASDPLLLDIGESLINAFSGGSGTGAFSFVSANPSVATVDPVTGLVTGLTAGGFAGEATLGITTITVSRAGDAEFLDAEPLSFTLQVSRVAQPPLVVSSDPLVLDIGQATVNVLGGAPEGTFVLVDIIGETFAMYQGINNLVTGLTAGTATITVGRTGTDSFLDAIPVTFDVIVNQLAQSPLEFDEEELNLMVGEVASNIATGGDGTNNISYSSSDPSVATVDANGNVEAITIGSATITANRLGDATFLDATPISYTVTVVAMLCTWDSSNWDECEWEEDPLGGTS